MARALAYFDTSALVKRYVQEAGGPAARALLRRHQVMSSAVAPVELMGALTRRRSAGEIEDRSLDAALSRIRDDRSSWTLVEVAALVLARAEDIVRTTSLRTLDAIHVASALVVQASIGAPLRFVTADARQRDAAASLGLGVHWLG